MGSLYLSDTGDVDRANVQVAEGHLHLQTHKIIQHIDRTKDR